MKTTANERKPAGRADSRFKILEFTNPRTDSLSWRVSGIKRDGTRIRDNFASVEAAQCRQIELETEWLARKSQPAIRATELSEKELRLAEATFAKLETPEEILLAVNLWLQQGKAQHVKHSVKLDEAVTDFKKWLDATAELRDHSKRNLKIRVDIFANSVANVTLSAITPEFVEEYLDKRNVSGATRDNDRRALSRFFSWCIERPRRWMASNPARDVKVERGEKQPPAILTVDQCEKLLRAAEDYENGKLAPYVAVCMFAGLRPFEASRLDWKQVNIKDGEMRLEGVQTKTGKPRTLTIHKTLKAWLQEYDGKPFFPSNWRKDFDAVKTAAGFENWTPDILRHTAISYSFRESGSYGLTAEQFGNSEAIIKAHYQSRVSTDDAKKFYAIKPKGAK